MIKISNGIHPIIVGEKLYQLTNHVLCLQFHNAFATHFSSHQLEIATMGGCEIIIIPFGMGTYQKNPLGKVLFTLTHFKDLHSIINDFFSCLFPSIVDDTHIINPLSIVSFTYEHFQIELYVISLSIQP
jgi:hypothetical protein